MAGQDPRRAFEPTAERLGLTLPHWLGEPRGRVILLAPTGVAARRLGKQTGRGTSTIHSSLFATHEEEKTPGRRREKVHFGEPRPPGDCGPRDLVVSDEGSFVDKKLSGTMVTEIIVRAKSSLLVVGDHEQLGPVEGEWGFPLWQARAKLTKVHRQAEGSPTLDFGTCIRERRMADFHRWSTSEDEGVWLHKHATVEDAVTWSEKRPESRVLITFTNKIRTLANRITREQRSYPRKEVVVGETLMNLFNNHDLGIMNGEMFMVSDVKPCDELSEAIGKQVAWVTEQAEVGEKARKFLVIPEMFDAFHPYQSDRQVYREAWAPLWARRVPKKEGEESDLQLVTRMQWSWEELHRWRDTQRMYALQATWGYCLTAHKAQGNQWPEVAFISCPTYRKLEDTDLRRRIAYVSATRAESVFGSFLLDVMPDYRKKNPYEAGAR